MVPDHLDRVRLRQHIPIRPPHGHMPLDGAGIVIGSDDHRRGDSLKRDLHASGQGEVDDGVSPAAGDYRLAVAADRPRSVRDLQVERNGNPACGHPAIAAHIFRCTYLRRTDYPRTPHRSDSRRVFASERVELCVNRSRQTSPRIEPSEVFGVFLECGPRISRYSGPDSVGTPIHPEQIYVHKPLPFDARYPHIECDFSRPPRGTSLGRTPTSVQPHPAATSFTSKGRPESFLSSAAKVVWASERGS